MTVGHQPVAATVTATSRLRHTTQEDIMTNTTQGDTPETSNVGNPHRDPATGLVDEDHAFGTWDNYPDGALDDLEARGIIMFEDELCEFGDGRTIVSIGVSKLTWREGYSIWTTVRPRADQAPRDYAGTPLSHYVSLAEAATVADIDEAVAWFEARGIEPGYARGCIERADAGHEHQVRREQARTELHDLVESISKGIPDRDWLVLVDELTAARKGTSPRVEEARRRLTELVANNEHLDFEDLRTYRVRR
jgi:hypothetical protein